MFHEGKSCEQNLIETEFIL